jgi:hypothetical protein
MNKQLAALSKARFSASACSSYPPLPLMFQGAFEASAQTAWLERSWAASAINRNLLKQGGILKMYNLQKAEYD